MKRFLLLGAIALMFTSVSCSNDDVVQQSATTELKTELTAKEDLPNPNHTAYMDSLISELNQDPQKILPWQSITCDRAVTTAVGTIGYEIGVIGGVRVIVHYTQYTGSTEVNWSWEICTTATCKC